MAIPIDFDEATIRAEVNAANARGYKTGWDAADAIEALELAAAAAPPWDFGEVVHPDLHLPDGRVVTSSRERFGAVAVHTAFSGDRVVLLHLEVIGSTTQQASARSDAMMRRSAYNWDEEPDDEEN